MTLRQIPLGLLLVLSIVAPAAVLAEPSPDGCTCVTTITGDGDHKEQHCDGFNPATHARCDCEKTTINDQITCVPKKAPGPNAQSRTNTAPRN